MPSPGLIAGPWTHPQSDVSVLPCTCPAVWAKHSQAPFAIDSPTAVPTQTHSRSPLDCELTKLS